MIFVIVFMYLGPKWITKLLAHCNLTFPMKALNYLNCNICLLLKVTLEIKMESSLERVYFVNSSAGNLDFPKIFESHLSFKTVHLFCCDSWCLKKLICLYKIISSSFFKFSQKLPCWFLIFDIFSIVIKKKKNIKIFSENNNSKF